MRRAIHVKRVYAPASPDDGRRVLVDRIWPRGVKRADAAIDEWLKEVAPSDALRRWFGHQPERWSEFVRRYREELKNEPQASALRGLAQAARAGPVTLLFGARDETHNQAVVLADALRAFPPTQS